MNSRTSAARPGNLDRFAEQLSAGAARLEQSARSLADSIERFSTTCIEFSAGQIDGLDASVSTTAHRDTERAVWVRGVATAFRGADEQQLPATGLFGRQIIDAFSGDSGVAHIAEYAATIKQNGLPDATRPMPFTVLIPVAMIPAEPQNPEPTRPPQPSQPMPFTVLMPVAMIPDEPGNLDGTPAQPAPDANTPADALPKVSAR